MSDKYAELDAVLDAESWEWLCENAPPLAKGVKKALEAGLTPSDIRRRVVERLGAHRTPLALRCEQAARYLATQKSNA